MAKKKSAADQADRPQGSPKSAEALEKEQTDDDSVERMVTSDAAEKSEGIKSVLPGPPIPPHVQEAVRNKKKED